MGWRTGVGGFDTSASSSETAQTGAPSDSRSGSSIIPLSTVWSSAIDTTSTSTAGLALGIGVAPTSMLAARALSRLRLAALLMTGTRGILWVARRLGPEGSWMEELVATEEGGGSEVERAKSVLFGRFGWCGSA